MDFPEELAALVPNDLLDLPGNVFNAGRHAFSAAAPIYLLGFNPGGNPTETTDWTPRRNIEKTLHESDANWSAFSDVSWDDRYGPGDHPMQRRILYLLGGVGLDHRAVPASNVVFSRSQTVSRLSRTEREWQTEACWPFHEAVISRLAVRTVVCMGQDAGRVVQRKLDANSQWSSRREANKRGWTSRGYSSPSGVNVVVLTHPGRSDWTSAAANVNPLVEEALRRS